MLRYFVTYVHVRIYIAKSILFEGEFSQNVIELTYSGVPQWIYILFSHLSIKNMKTAQKPD